MRGNDCRDASAAEGFSLLELTIVLAIIGAIVGGGLVILTTTVKTQQVNTTVAKMAVIEKALSNYAMVFSRLPCPSSLTKKATDTGYGTEAENKGSCTGGTLAANNIAASGTAEGGVPTRALKLTDDYMFDGWGRRFRYAVDPDKTAANAFPATSCTSPKGITVNDASGSPRTSSAIYALISHGADGHGAYTASGVVYGNGSTNTDEKINCHCSSATPPVAATYTPAYVEKLATASPTDPLNNFDDIVTFKEDWQIQALNYPRTAASCGMYLVMQDGFGSYPRAYYVANGTVTKLPPPASYPGWNWGGMGMDFTPDNKMLATGGSPYNSYGSQPSGSLYRVAKTGLTYYMDNLTDSTGQGDVIFTPDGQYMVTASSVLSGADHTTVSDSSINMYSKASGYSTQVSSTPSYTQRPSKVMFAWNPDSSILYVGNWGVPNGGGALNGIDLYTRSGTTLTYLKTIGGDNGWTTSISVHPSGNFIAIGGDYDPSGMIYGPAVLANPAGAATQISVTGSGLAHGISVGAAWTPDGNFLGAGPNAAAIYAFNPTGPGGVYFTPMTIVGNTCTSLKNVAFSSDSQYFAVAGDIDGQRLCVFKRNTDGTVWTSIYNAPGEGSGAYGSKMMWSH